MMNRSELKDWAKNKREGHKLDIWIALIIITAISSIGGSIPGVGLLVVLGSCVINVGFIVYMTNLVNDKEFKIDLLFGQFENFVNILKVYIVEYIYVFLWTLLLIIPGIIKGLGYSMVSYLLADPKYKDKPVNEILMTSEKMMDGHKMEFFMLSLSFVGWYILACFSFGIYFIWLVPWYMITITKFMLNIKDAYEGNNVVSSSEDMSNDTIVENNNLYNSESDIRYCTNCGNKIDSNSRFCTNCGKEI